MYFASIFETLILHMRYAISILNVYNIIVIVIHNHNIPLL